MDGKDNDVKLAAEDSAVGLGELIRVVTATL
jgi:hypothetical protein